MATSNQDEIAIAKAGDTLRKIATRHGITYQELAEYNQITNADRIYIGQRLRIPKPRDVGVIKFRLFDFIGEAIEGLECKVVSLGEELMRIKTDAKGALPDIKAKDALDIFELWVKRFGTNEFKKVPDCKDYPTQGNSLDWKGPSCDSINWRGKKCHIFMLNESNEIAGVGRVDIGRDTQLIKGKPFCFDVKAMTAPPEVPDAFLVTLGYIDSAWFPDPRNEPDQFLTTVLLRLKQEPNGKLTITHDTACLDSTNRIANLGAARKRLRECAAHLGK